MNSIIVLILGALAIGVGYGWYGRRIDRNIIRPDPNKATPAKMYMDGVDFTPASRNVLFGYQFKSIAALGPIVGPITAVAWGWLPALIWIILGTFFIGWVQDYGTMMMGVRRDGETLGALSYRLISPRARTILLLFIYGYLWLIMGAFGKIVGYDLMTNPRVPLGMLSVVLMGVLAGQMTYRWKQDIILTTVVTVVLTFVGIWLGTRTAVQNFFNAIYGIQTVEGQAVSPTLFLDVTQARLIGSLLVMLFCYLGAVLPIWSYAQPINYVSFWIIGLGMLGGVIGMLIWHPGMGDFPAFTSFVHPTLGPLWPVLFVTIACGAISGWHSLVSTSGTARQLEKETDALPVGGGAMFMEMALAIIAFLTATVAYGSLAAYQEQFAKGGGSVFAVGLATFLERIGIPKSFGVAFGSVFLTIMALTIMQLAVRFMRVASAEFLGNRVPAFKNVHVGSIVAIVLSLILVWTGFWARIWVLFGGANQLMAGLALFLVSIWLFTEGKNNQWAFWPSMFMIVTTIGALLVTAYNVFRDVATKPGLTAAVVIGNIVAGVIAVLLVVAAVILAVDGWKALRKPRKVEAAEAAETA